MVNVRRIATLSAAASFLFAVLVTILPGLFLVAFGGVSGLVATIMLFGFAFVGTFVVLFILGYIVSVIPKSWGVILGLGILAIGLVLFQPELDFVGLVTILFVFYGRYRALPKG